jgi:hypothetical protein
LVIDMEKVKEIISKKPMMFVIISLAYTVAVIFLKWQIHPKLESLLFVAGSVIGIYFLDIAESFFQVHPSPFSSVVFGGGLVVVSLFIVSSSGSSLATGLVLALYLTLIMRQVAEWRQQHNLNSWYELLSQTVTPRTQLFILAFFIVMFLGETLIYIR